MSRPQTNVRITLTQPQQGSPLADIANHITVAGAQRKADNRDFRIQRRHPDRALLNHILAHHYATFGGTHVRNCDDLDARI